MSLRVAVIPERLGSVLSPCGTIRLSTFFDAMRGAAAGKWQVRYLIPEEVAAFRPDVVVWQRTAMADEQQVDSIAMLAKRLGCLMVYDLDDNLFELDDEAERRAYEVKLKAVEKSLQVADQVWCSTVELAERVSGMTRHRPLTMANALDPEMWGTPPMPASEEHLGPVHSLMYMGTRTHAADLELLGQAMDMLEERRPGHYRLDIVGVASNYPERPWMHVLEIPGYVGASYPAFVNWLSRQGPRRLGVAPLLSSPFNDCKSCIKVLDYAALGMPTLASDVPAYRPMQVDLECFKSDNSPDAWAEKIELVCGDDAQASLVMSNARLRIGQIPFFEAVRIRMDAISSGHLAP